MKYTREYTKEEIAILEFHIKNQAALIRILLSDNPNIFAENAELRAENERLKKLLEKQRN